MAAGAGSRIWSAWASPWRGWRDRLFAWIAATDLKRCPGCGFQPRSPGHPELGPTVCPRCGARYEIPGR